LRGAQDDQEQLAKLTRSVRPQKSSICWIWNNKYFEQLPKERARVPGEINSDPGPQRQRQREIRVFSLSFQPRLVERKNGGYYLDAHAGAAIRYQVLLLLVMGVVLYKFPLSLSLHKATPKVISLHDRKDMYAESESGKCVTKE